MTKSFFITLMGLMVVLLPGCQKEKPAPVLHEQVQPVVPVSFPEIPDFDSVLEKVKPGKDGIYTTWSAVFNQKTLLNKEIRVKGEIVDISEDCPDITKPKQKAVTGKRGKITDPVEPDEQPEVSRCSSVYVVIKSPEDQNYPLLITNYHPYYHPYFKIGMELDVTGNYVLYGNGFIQAKNGLLIISEIHTAMGVDKSGKFTTDQAEIREMQSKGTLLTTRHKQKQDNKDSL